MHKRNLTAVLVLKYLLTKKTFIGRVNVLKKTVVIMNVMMKTMKIRVSIVILVLRMTMKYVILRKR